MKRPTTSVAAVSGSRRSQAPRGVSARLSRSGLQVLAFRDEHRAQQLTQKAAEFARCWFLGRQEGPTQRVMTSLHTAVAVDVKGELRGAVAVVKEKGVEGLVRLLSPERRPAGLSLRSHRTVASAANEEDDTAFVLEELELEDEGGKRYNAYQILKLDFLMDETSNAVTAIQERGQWDVAGDGLTPILMDLQQQQRRGGSAAEEEGMMHEGKPVLGSRLPWEHIVPQSELARITKPWGGMTHESLVSAARSWCAAHSSHSDLTAATKRTDPRIGLEQLLAADFRQWDAYALLPLMCVIRGAPEGVVQKSGGLAEAAEKAGGAVMVGGGGCVAPREAMYDIIRNMQAEYDMCMSPFDIAVSLAGPMVMMHWHCKLTPRAGSDAGHPAFEVEGVELDLFDSDGRLLDAWTFRDALPFESQLLLSRRQQLTPAAAAAAPAARQQKRQ